MSKNPSILMFAVAAVLLPSQAVAAQDTPPARPDIDAMVQCVWDNAAASTNTWLDAPKASILKEFNSFEKSTKTLVWLRMVAACNTVLKPSLPGYQEDAFAKRVAETRPSVVGNDIADIQALQCLYWVTTSDGEKKYTAGSWGYISAGKLTVTSQQSVPTIADEQQAEDNEQCSYIQSDGSLSDA